MQNETNNPRVTVLMPIYNGETYLKEATDSILNQTYKDFEFLIINDGSKDRSAEIISKYTDPRINLVHNEKNLGLITTLNNGIEIAKGEYIVRMDCDDISVPDRIEKQVKFMDENPEVGMSSSCVELYGLHRKMFYKIPSDYEEIKCDFLFNVPFFHPAMILRKSTLNKYNLRYPDQLYSEDHALWIKASKLFPLKNIPEALVYYRIHKSQICQACSSEQSVTTINLRKNLLHELGFTYNQEEEILLDKLLFYRDRWFSTKAEMKKVEEMLLRIISCNNEKNTYKEQALLKMLSEFWLSVFMESTKKGTFCWDIFINSPLAKELDLKTTDKIKYFILSIIGFMGAYKFYRQLLMIYYKFKK